MLVGKNTQKTFIEVGSKNVVVSSLVELKSRHGMASGGSSCLCQGDRWCL